MKHFSMCAQYLDNIPPSVVSDDDTAVLISEETTLRALVTTQKLYKFYHPGTTQCNNTGQCGFLLKVTPVSAADPGSFNIELVTDVNQYPYDVHYHGVVSGGDIHLSVEWYHMRS